MKQAIQVMRDVCAAKQVTPDEVLGYLLEALHASHGLTAAAAGFAGGGTVNRSNFFNEVVNWLPLAGRRGDVPVSMLDALDVCVAVQLVADKASINLITQKGASIPEPLARKERAETALRLIVRELMNTGDHQALLGRMKIEEMQDGTDPDGNSGGDDKPPKNDA